MCISQNIDTYKDLKPLLEITLEKKRPGAVGGLVGAGGAKWSLSCSTYSPGLLGFTREASLETVQKPPPAVLRLSCSPPTLEQVSMLGYRGGRLVEAAQASSGQKASLLPSPPTAAQTTPGIHLPIPL